MWRRTARRDTTFGHSPTEPARAPVRVETRRERGSLAGAGRHRMGLNTSVSYPEGSSAVPAFTR